MGTGRVAIALIVLPAVGLLSAVAISIVTGSTWPATFGAVWFFAVPVVGLMFGSELAPVCTRHHRSRWERYFWCKQAHRSSFFVGVGYTMLFALGTVAGLVMTNELAFAVCALTMLLFLAATIPRRSALRPLTHGDVHTNHGRTTVADPNASHHRQHRS